MPSDEEVRQLKSLSAKHLGRDVSTEREEFREARSKLHRVKRRKEREQISGKTSFFEEC